MKHLCLWLVIGFAGCATAPLGDTALLSQPQGEVPQPSSPALDKEVVSERQRVGAPPSINARFLSEGLDVDRWSQRFEGESREVYRSRVQIVEALALRPGQVVADVGAGTGLFVAYLSEAVGPDGAVIAVDISPDFVAHIQARAAAAGLENVRTQLGAQDDVLLDEASVDLIYTCDTYHHFEDTAAILESMRKALKPGGRLVVVDYHRIEGKTRPFLMEHVRAGQSVFSAEIEAAGFTRLPDPETPFLDENYMMVFER